jgi:hypothetical protein
MLLSRPERVPADGITLLRLTSIFALRAPTEREKALFEVATGLEMAAQGWHARRRSSLNAQVEEASLIHKTLERYPAIKWSRSTAGEFTYRDRISVDLAAKPPEGVWRIRMERKDPGKCVPDGDTRRVPVDFVNYPGEGHGRGKRWVYKRPQHREHHRAANRCDDECFHNSKLQGLLPMREITAGLRLTAAESPVVRIHRGQMGS